MRISVEHQDRLNINYPDRMYLISKNDSTKNNGWLTVDSQTLSRKNAYENKTSLLVNRETSPLAPSWMQNVNHIK